MKKKLNIIYHCYCKNNWLDIVKEHFAFLKGENIHITMIGSKIDQLKLEEIILHFSIKANIYRYQSASIFEHKAILLLRDLALRYPNRNTFYFHTKGASSPTEVNKRWRNYMNFHLVSNYKQLHHKLQNTNKDATGVLYTINNTETYRKTNKVVNFFAGNFWLASNNYLVTLPDYDNLRQEYLNSRFLAEVYIGWNNPNILYIDQKGTMTLASIINKIQNDL